MDARIAALNLAIDCIALLLDSEDARAEFDVSAAERDAAERELRAMRDALTSAR